jgi:SAM-dependent methyltransferase
MTEHRPLDLPSAFVCDWTARVFGSVPPPRRALDLATGNGRHALALAEIKFNVFAVDRRLDALHIAATHARRRGLEVKLWCADLTAYPLPAERFELLVVTRYLQRDLFPALSLSLVPGGVLVYETFTESQRALGRGPTSPDHLLKAGEL